MTTPLLRRGNASISDCGTYRYWLTRQWESAPCRWRRNLGVRI